MKLEPLTADKLRQLLHYDPTTGVFTWRERPMDLFHSERIGRGWNSRMAGRRAGAPHNQGYWRLSLGSGRQFLCHRLAFLYMTGVWPDADIDHMNGDRSDNRWDNLRAVDRSTNCENRRTARKDSRVGLMGVSRNKGKFYAKISVRGVPMHLGSFSTPEEAHGAYMRAKRTFHHGFCE